MNITIPHSVRSIGDLTFYNCSNLENAIIGESVETIGDSAFDSCSYLKCIYFYVTNEPNISTNAFQNVAASSVMTLVTYKGETFGGLIANKETATEGCTQLHTLAFTHLSAFTQSRSFTDSLPPDATFSHSLTLTLSLSVTQTITVLSSFSLSHSLSATGSTSTQVQTQLVFYEYKFIAYPTCYSLFSDFFTIIYMSAPHENSSATTAAVAAAIVVSLLVVLLIHVRHKKCASGKSKSSSVSQNKASEVKTFSGVMPMINIEDDPFAADFNEGKLFEQV